MKTPAALIVLVACCGVAHAAPKQAAPVQAEEAKQLFERGMAALDAGKFALARDAFGASLALQRTRATAFNLAVALRGTGEVRAAVRLLREIEAGAYGALDAERTRQVASLAQELEATLATLSIRVSGAPWAEVRVNGELVAGKVQELTQPLGYVVDPGQVVVTAAAPGMKSVEVRPTLRPAERREVQLRLEPAVDEPGLLIVRTRDDTEITVEGVGSGKGQLQHKLPPDWYRVRLHNEHGEALSRVQVRGSQTTLLELPAPTPPLLKRPWFWLATGTVLAAAGVATYLWLSRAPEPTSDPVFGTVYLLRTPPVTPGQGRAAWP